MVKDKYFGLSPRIARWKIDTPFENWLSRKADKSLFWKKLYVIFYRIFDNKYYNGGIKLAKEAIELRKEELGMYSEKYIICDMIYCLHRFGISFQDYCIYGFIDRNSHYRETFVSDKLRYHISNIRSFLNVMCWDAMS